MKTNKIKKYRWPLMFALILAILVAASTIVVAERMAGYYLDDTGAIPITNEIQEMEEDSDEVAEEAAVAENAEFGVEDVEGEWTTNTKVDIFRVSYENGENVVTVLSDDGEKVIAPGTKNAYSFKLKNTGDAPVSYEMKVKAYITPEGTDIPVKARVSRYDGTWLAGDKDNFVDVLDLNNIEEKANLGSGKYTYYTLDWQWPFDQGTDELDTLLGNLAVDEDLVLTIEIQTTAQADESIEGDGILSPKTGDDFHTVLWIAIAVCMITLIFLLLFTRRKDDEEA